MAFQPVANTTEVIIKWRQGGQERIITLYYQWAGSPPVVTQLQALTEAIETTMIPKLQVCWHVSAVLESIQATNINAAGGAQYINYGGASYPGLQGGDKEPGNVAAVISKRSGLTGRRHRGRNYIGSFSESDVSGDDIGSALLARLVALGTQMLASYVGSVFKAAVASRTAGTSQLLLSIVVDSLVDSMRTRLTGRGD